LDGRAGFGREREPWRVVVRHAVLSHVAGDRGGGRGGVDGEVARGCAVFRGGGADAGLGGVGAVGELRARVARGARGARAAVAAAFEGRAGLAREREGRRVVLREPVLGDVAGDRRRRRGGVDGERPRRGAGIGGDVRDAHVERVLPVRQLSARVARTARGEG